MPRKSEQVNDGMENEKNEPLQNNENHQNEIENLNRMLAAVLNYLSDDEVEEIDIEYLLNHTEGLRQWWDQCRESNKKLIEEEIIKSLGGLSLKELENIKEQIKEKTN